MVTGPPHVRFYAGASVKAPDGVIVGSLCAMASQPRLTTEAEVAALAAVRDTLEEILRLQYELNSDPLTGALKIQHLIERLEQELRHAQRHREPLSMLVSKLDYFNASNQT